MWRCTPDDELVGLSAALGPRHAKLSGAPLELLLGDPLCILRQVSLIQGVALDDPSLGELLPQVPNLILLLFGTRTCHGSGHHASSSAFIVGLLRLSVLAPPGIIGSKTGPSSVAIAGALAESDEKTASGSFSSARHVYTESTPPGLVVEEPSGGAQTSRPSPFERPFGDPSQAGGASRIS